MKIFRIKIFMDHSGKLGDLLNVQVKLFNWTLLEKTYGFVKMEKAFPNPIYVWSKESIFPFYKKEEMPSNYWKNLKRSNEKDREENKLFNW